MCDLQDGGGAGEAKCEYFAVRVVRRRKEEDFGEV